MSWGEVRMLKFNQPRCHPEQREGFHQRVAKSLGKVALSNTWEISRRAVPARDDRLAFRRAARSGFRAQSPFRAPYSALR